MNPFDEVGDLGDFDPEIAIGATQDAEDERAATMSDLTELELAEIALREDEARRECYLREDDSPEAHPIEEGIVCARCYGALADENERLLAQVENRDVVAAVFDGEIKELQSELRRERKRSLQLVATVENLIGAIQEISGPYSATLVADDLKDARAVLTGQKERE